MSHSRVPLGSLSDHVKAIPSLGSRPAHPQPKASLANLGTIADNDDSDSDSSVSSSTDDDDDDDDDEDDDDDDAEKYGAASFLKRIGNTASSNSIKKEASTAKISNGIQKIEQVKTTGVDRADKASDVKSNKANGTAKTKESESTSSDSSDSESTDSTSDSEDSDSGSDDEDDDDGDKADGKTNGSKPSGKQTTKPSTAMAETSSSEDESNASEEEEDVTMQDRKSSPAAKTSKTSKSSKSSKSTNAAKVAFKSAEFISDSAEDEVGKNASRSKAVAPKPAPASVIDSTSEFASQGFQLRKANDDVDASDVANLFRQAQRDGKQLWYFTAPASVPITVVEKMYIPLDRAQQGLSVLSHDNQDYTISFDDAQASKTIKLMIPNKAGDKYSMHRSIDQTVHLKRVTEFSQHASTTRSATMAPTTTSAAPKKQPRPQPAGLRSRFVPIGVPDSDVIKSTATATSTASASAVAKRKLPIEDAAAVGSTPKKVKKDAKIPVATKVTPVVPPVPIMCSTPANGKTIKAAATPVTTNGATTAASASTVKKQSAILPPNVAGSVKKPSTTAVPLPSSSQTSFLLDTPSKVVLGGNVLNGGSSNGSSEATAKEKKTSRKKSEVRTSAAKEIDVDVEMADAAPAPEANEAADMTSSAKKDRKEKKDKKEKKEKREKKEKTSSSKKTAASMETPKKVTPVPLPRM